MWSPMIMLGTKLTINGESAATLGWNKLGRGRSLIATDRRAVPAQRAIPAAGRNRSGNPSKIQSVDQRMHLECGVRFFQLRTCRRTRPGQLWTNSGSQWTFSISFNPRGNSATTEDQRFVAYGCRPQPKFSHLHPGRHTLHALLGARTGRGSRSLHALDVEGHLHLAGLLELQRDQQLVALLDRALSSS